MEQEALRKILFVDDEQNILLGLKRMLRSMRKSLDMHFAESGHAALELMAKEKFDVIISDMRMPGMDGAELLAEVKKLYPHTIRIILTGQADEDSILRTVGVTHQFLAKPCDPELLKTIIKRSCSLHDLLSNGELKNIISSIGQLPSLPKLYQQLQGALRNPEITADEIGQLIEQDMAMSAKILQLVNSSFFGLVKRVETPGRAVKLLGLDTIKILVLSLEIFSELKDDTSLLSSESLYSHSMVVAQCAKLIASDATDDEEVIANSFIAGLLHDIGKLVLLSKMKDDYISALSLAHEEQISLLEAEKKTFDATHHGVGAYLVGLWGLNGSIVEAIGFHGRIEDYPGELFNAALAVHFANIAYYEYFGDKQIGSPLQANEEYIARSGLTDKVTKWLQLCYEYIDKLEQKE